MFVDKFLKSKKNSQLGFCIDMIERKFNIDREKKNKRPIQFSNMERLMIVSLLLKAKGIKRTYEKSSKGGFRVLFKFEKNIEQKLLEKRIEEEIELCLWST